MLDFKGWTKTAEDKKTTTLKHDKGHSMTLAHTKLPKIQQEALKRLKFAEGGDVAPDKSPVTVNVNPPGQAMSQPVQSPQPVPVQQPSVPPSSNVLLPNGSMNAPATAQAGQQGADLAAKVAESKSQAAVPQQQQYLNQTAQLNQDFTNNINSLVQHADDLSNYQKQNPLKENAYMENMGAGKRVATGLGLILSGAGSGLTGGPNLAYDFLNKQIDRNIDAQKTRFGQAATVWGAYKDLYGNEQVANNMARVHALDMLSHQADLTAAQLGTPTARAANLQFKSQLAAERNKQIMEAAGNLNSIPNNPSRNAAPSAGERNVTPSVGPQASPQAEEPQANNEGMMSKYLHGRLGSSGEQSTANVSKSGIEKPVIYPVLSPDAESKLNGTVQYGAPGARQDYASVLQQYTGAQQLEKFLNGPNGDGKNGIHEIFNTLYANSGSGGISGIPGALQRMAHISIPGTGQSIKVPAMTEAQKSYEVQQNRLKTDLAGALKGLVSVNDIDDMVNKYSPGAGDSPELVKEKEAGFVNSVKNALQSSQLGRYKMLAK